MAKAVFKQQGASIDYTPGAAVSAGDVINYGGVPLIAKLDIPANELGALATEGVFDVQKDNSDITAGDTLYWDVDGDPVGGTTGDGAVTKTDTNNLAMGFAITDAGTAVERVRVRLNV